MEDQKQRLHAGASKIRRWDTRVLRERGRRALGAVLRERAESYSEQKMTTSTDMNAETTPPESCGSQGRPVGNSGSVSGASPCSALREAIERDIKAIASIYPTAFGLYDEPLERLVGRLERTFLKQNGKGSAAE